MIVVMARTRMAHATDISQAKRRLVDQDEITNQATRIQVRKASHATTLRALGVLFIQIEEYLCTSISVPLTAHRMPRLKWVAKEPASLQPLRPQLVRSGD